MDDQAQSRQDQVIRRVKSAGPWFHQIDLGGVRTRDIDPASGPQPIDHPWSRWEAIKDVLPGDLSGSRLLDLGCADGFFSVEFARLGASEVVAVDPWRNAIERVKLVADFYQLRDVILPRQGSVYDIASLGDFDVVMMLAVLYHLDHPLLGLQEVAKVTSSVYLESVVVDNEEESFLFYRQPSEAPGAQVRPKWVPTKRCVKDMLRAVGFVNIEQVSDHDPVRPIYLATKEGHAPPPH